MNKDDVEIMVVEKNILLGNNYFQGFKDNKDVNFEEVILDNYFYIRRGDAEHNFNLKQPISYMLLYNPKLDFLFAYERSKENEKYSETRLQGKVSCGVGGHIEKVDLINNNPIHDSMLRELEEEVEFIGKRNPKVIGYINDDSNDVGKVHFGILYFIETDASIIIPKAKEMKNGKLLPFDYIDKFEELNLKELVVEDWSKIAIGALKNYLGKI